MKNSTAFHPAAATLLAHAGSVMDAPGAGIVPPIAPGTTYVRDSNYGLVDERFSYFRAGSPNWRYVEELMRDLEAGADALLFSSGLSASTVLFHTLSAGDHVVIPTVMYHGMRDWVRQFCNKRDIGLSEYETGSLDSLNAAIQPGSTRVVWIESPANPTWVILDIAAACEMARQAGALSVVDSTVSTPLITRPITLGADYVVHSATKYLNGHSDVLGGVLVCAKDDEVWQQVQSERTGGGAVMGAFEAWLLLRGMRTLDVRLQRACSNARFLAENLTDHPQVSNVMYPGLESHPDHDVAVKQMRGGFGGMLSILVAGGETAAAHVATHTRLFRPATSLGGVESLVEHRALVENPDSPIPRNLLRLSVGIEDPHDLLQDLGSALSGSSL